MIVAMHERYGKIYRPNTASSTPSTPNLARNRDAKLKEGRMDADVGWVDDDLPGIDAGPILLMIENHHQRTRWEDDAQESAHPPGPQRWFRRRLGWTPMKPGGPFALACAFLSRRPARAPPQREVKCGSGR